MRIAFATNGKSLKAKIWPHFGWAKNYLIYDTKTKKFKIYKNPEVSGGKELPPDFLNRLKVDVVITYALGPKAFNKFKKFRIKLYKAVNQNIKENIKQFQAGKLKELGREDIF